MNVQLKRKQLNDKLAPFILLAFTLLYYLTFFNYGLEVDDEGFFLLGASEVLRGKWPMADFSSYGPLSYWGLAGFFKVLGQGVMAERILLMILLLLNGQAVLWIARRFLPLGWALAIAGLYAFAPGPWYKLFFVSTVLLVAMAALHYLDKPDWKRAMGLGLSVGFGFLVRKETGMMGLPFMAGVLALPHLKTLLEEKRFSVACIGHGLAAIAGAAMLPVFTGAFYMAAGKWEILWTNSLRVLLNAHAREMFAKMGILTPFDPLRVVTHLDLEQAFYTGGLVVVAVTLGGLRAFFVNPAGRQAAMHRIALGVAALMSMTYCYLFVWGTRMLSTFPLVYLCYAMTLLAVAKKIGRVRLRWYVLVAGCALLVLPVLDFTKHQIYSGSITTRFGKTAEVDHPLLRGIHVYETNRMDIERLQEEMAKAPLGASMVSMSESTTMGFLSGLSNPTVYRAFSLEFARPGEEEKAIETFERMKITYFIARRVQFLDGGGPASDLDSYAPKIKAYLLAHYEVIPLGEHSVLLRRKDLSSS